MFLRELKSGEEGVVCFADCAEQGGSVLWLDVGGVVVGGCGDVCRVADYQVLGCEGEVSAWS